MKEHIIGISLIFERNILNLIIIELYTEFNLYAIIFMIFKINHVKM